MEGAFKGLGIVILLLGGVAFVYVSCIMVWGLGKEKVEERKTNRFNQRVEALEKKALLQKNADAGRNDLEQRRSRRKL